MIDFCKPSMYEKHPLGRLWMRREQCSQGIGCPYRGDEDERLAQLFESRCDSPCQKAQYQGMRHDLGVELGGEAKEVVGCGTRAGGFLYRPCPRCSVENLCWEIEKTTPLLVCVDRTEYPEPFQLCVLDPVGNIHSPRVVRISGAVWAYWEEGFSEEDTASRISGKGRCTQTEYTRPT